MSEKKKQVKTYKDIIMGDVADGSYDIDIEKEKKLKESQENLKETTKVLLKFLGGFLVIALLYLFVTRVIFEIKRDPIYFSNIFNTKIEADNKKSFEIFDDKQINIDFLKKKNIEIFKNKDNNFNILFLLKKNINGELENLYSLEFLTKIDDTFIYENIRSFGENFALASFYSENRENYFAFFDVDNFSAANKYMILWEKRFLKKNEKNEKINGFITKNIRNIPSRILIDYDGNYLFGYSFADQKTLVFFDNANIFKEVVGRIIMSK